MLFLNVHFFMRLPWSMWLANFLVSGQYHATNEPSINIIIDCSHIFKLLTLLTNLFQLTYQRLKFRIRH